MNVTFHTLGSIAVASALSFRTGEMWRSFSSLPRYAAGFIAGILIHGVLDVTPHNYPLSSKLDIAMAMLLFLVALVFTRPRNMLLLAICFAGCLMPDIIDLGPAIANKYLGLPVPQLPYKFFPWHWPEYSGSIYDGSRAAESGAYHIIFTVFCTALILRFRRDLARL